MENDSSRVSSTERALIRTRVALTLQERVASKKFAYVGNGAEIEFGISYDRLRIILIGLREDGYAIHRIRVGEGDMVRVAKVLTGPTTTHMDVWRMRDEIRKAIPKG